MRERRSRLPLRSVNARVGLMCACVFALAAHGVLAWTTLVGKVGHQDQPRKVCRRQFCVGAGLAPHVASAAPPPATLGSELPAAVVVLRVAEVTEKMEQLMLQAALYQKRGEGEELVVGRPQMEQSIGILLSKTKLGQMPNSGAAVKELRSIAMIALAGQGALSSEELVNMARAYSRARDALRRVFESFSEAERGEAKLVFRRLQEEDRARMLSE